MRWGQARLSLLLELDLATQSSTKGAYIELEMRPVGFRDPKSKNRHGGTVLDDTDVSG